LVSSAVINTSIGSCRRHERAPNNVFLQSDVAPPPTGIVGDSAWSEDVPVRVRKEVRERHGDIGNGDRRRAWNVRSGDPGRRVVPCAWWSNLRPPVARRPREKPNDDSTPADRAAGHHPTAGCVRLSPLGVIRATGGSPGRSSLRARAVELRANLDGDYGTNGKNNRGWGVMSTAPPRLNAAPR